MNMAAASRSSSFRSLHCFVGLLLRFCFCATMKKRSSSNFPLPRTEAVLRVPQPRKGISKRILFSINSWKHLKRIISGTVLKTQTSDLERDDRQRFSSQTRPKVTNINAEAKRRRNSARLPNAGQFTSPIALKRASVSSRIRANTHPCGICGEVFSTTHILDHHQSIKHAVSELTEGDSGRRVVEIIFQTGWMKVGRHPRILTIVKIHTNPKILNRFEEYRETVKARASRTGSRWQQRCLVDGNELLRFHCATVSCSLGQGGKSSLCNRQFCSVCGIIKHGFSPKLDRICTYSSSYAAHRTMEEDIGEEFAFMNAKRAILICRVIAGRIAYQRQLHLKEGYDSVAGQSGEYPGLEELYLFSPKAILPCFVIMYNV